VNATAQDGLGGGRARRRLVMRVSLEIGLHHKLA
jgi:hypothetical protein